VTSSWPATEEEFTRMLAGGIPFSTAPGTNYEYSNYGFAILGRVVSRVSGMPYAKYVQANILTPLGLTSTTLEPKSVARDRIALGYRWEDNTWKEEPPLPDGAFGSMGGMLTSTRDLAKYVGFLMNAWPARDGADPGPVKRSSLREMQQPWRARPGYGDWRNGHSTSRVEQSRVRVRPRHTADVRLPVDRLAQRWVARVWIADAVAGGRRRGFNRHGEFDVHRLGRSARPGH
jgi:CubicO group peptidase (beta-lactamase class C family)